MAPSKEYFLSSNKHPFENGISRENNQFKNLNLNQNRKFENLKTVKSEGVLSKIGKGFVNSERCDLLTRNDDSWKNNDICEKFGNLNLRNSDQFMPKRNSIHSTETFAINIKTYESFGDTRIYDGEFEGGRNGILQKKCGKFSFMNFVGRITNAFEFPRQQENGGSEPEIMQFRASQHLDRSRRSEQRSIIRHEQQQLLPLVHAADRISRSMNPNRWHISVFRNLLNNEHRSLNYPENQVYENWMKCVTAVKRRYDLIELYPYDAAEWFDLDEKVKEIVRRFRPDFLRVRDKNVLNQAQRETGNIDRTVSPPQSHTVNNNATTNPPSVDQPSEPVTTESHHKRRRSSSIQSIPATNKRPMLNVNGSSALMVHDDQLGSLASSVANERRQAFHGNGEQRNPQNQNQNAAEIQNIQELRQQQINGINATLAALNSMTSQLQIPQIPPLPNNTFTAANPQNSQLQLSQLPPMPGNALPIAVSQLLFFRHCEALLQQQQLTNDNILAKNWEVARGTLHEIGEIMKSIHNNNNNKNATPSQSPFQFPAAQPSSSEPQQGNIPAATPSQQTSQPTATHQQPPLQIPVALPAAILPATENPNSAVMDRMLCAQINANDITTTAIFQGSRHENESMEAAFMAQIQSNAAIIQSIVRIFGNKK